jgi:hypothetical protein
MASVNAGMSDAAAGNLLEGLACYVGHYGDDLELDSLQAVSEIAGDLLGSLDAAEGRHIEACTAIDSALITRRLEVRARLEGTTAWGLVASVGAMTLAEAQAAGWPESYWHAARRLGSKPRAVSA